MSDQNDNEDMKKSMSPPADLKVYSDGDVEMALSQLININADNILHEPTCIICSSPQRDEVEKKFIENKNYDETIALFKTKSTGSISRDVIDNHMRFHYERGIKELQKIEYIGRIKRLNSVELTTLDRIKIGFSAIDERLMGINSITPSGDLSAAEVEKIKSTETSRLMLVYNQLLKLKATMLGEMKSGGELIMLPRQSFVDIFNRALTEAKNDEERELIQKILRELGNLSSKTQ